jgi:cell division protein FtsI (penicillin-binding protein 3)
MTVDTEHTRDTAPRGSAMRIQLEGVRKQALDMGRSRLLVTGAVIMMAFVAISVRLVDLMVLGGAREPGIAQARFSPQAPVVRADIVDRNGILVATSLPTASLYADPAMVLDADDAANQLLSVIPDLDRVGLVAKLKSKRRFIWLRRNLTPDQHHEVNRLGIPGLAFQNEERRVYPHGSLLSHVVGLTDRDGNGIAGVERYFDGVLDGNRETLRLSLDVRVQSLVREELAYTVEKFSAIGGAAVVMDVNTGELVSMVSLPDFDPNLPSGAIGDAIFNRVTKGVYEMGSTFKLFTAAMALDAGTVDIGGGYDASKPIRVARFTISDYHAKNRWLSVPEILIHSSNIGAAKMAVDVGSERQQEYLRNLGLLSPSRIELPEIGSPLKPATWREINTMTISYGHGIAVSPLQLTSGISVLVNGGMSYPATLLIHEGEAPVRGERVISPTTSLQLRGLMRLVVRHGTGKKAEAPGYMVGGKTGTADKQGGGGYERNKRIASFVAAFPINDPRYVVLVLVDEPKGIEETFNYATGGWVAAPAVGRIVAGMGPLLGVPTVEMAALDASTPEGFIKAWEQTFEAR